MEIIPKRNDGRTEFMSYPSDFDRRIKFLREDILDIENTLKGVPGTKRGDKLRLDIQKNKGEIKALIDRHNKNCTAGTEVPMDYAPR